MVRVIAQAALDDCSQPGVVVAAGKNGKNGKNGKGDVMHPGVFALHVLVFFFSFFLFSRVHSSPPVLSGGCIGTRDIDSSHEHRSAYAVLHKTIFGFD